jgi:hypothetical protein
LYDQDSGDVVVFPFAVVEYDLLSQISDPPHTEDFRYDPSTIRFIKRLDGKQKRELLDKILFDSVKSIFEVPIYTDLGFYVLHGSGPRSLGSVRPTRIIRVIYERGEGEKWRYRLDFEDGTGDTYWLSVTDLTWRYFCDVNCQMNISFEEITSNLARVLRSTGVYLRIGLARGWEKFPDRCFLQVTGVYTFPDYAGGKVFSDFIQKE